MEFGLVFFVGLAIVTIFSLMNVFDDNKKWNEIERAQNTTCVNCRKTVSKAATACPYCTNNPNRVHLEEDKSVIEKKIESKKTICFHCKEIVSAVATICPYCRKNPKRIDFVQ